MNVGNDWVLRQSEVLPGGVVQTIYQDATGKLHVARSGGALPIATPSEAIERWHADLHPQTAEHACDDKNCTFRRCFDQILQFLWGQVDQPVDPAILPASFEQQAHKLMVAVWKWLSERSYSLKMKDRDELSKRLANCLAEIAYDESPAIPLDPTEVERLVKSVVGPKTARPTRCQNVNSTLGQCCLPAGHDGYHRATGRAWAAEAEMPLSDEAIEADLKAAGIDMEPGYERLRELVAKARAARLTPPGEVEAAWKRIEEGCRDDQDRCVFCGSDDRHKDSCDLMAIKPQPPSERSDA